MPEQPPAAGSDASQLLLPRPEAARPDALRAEMDAVRPTVHGQPAQLPLPTAAAPTPAPTPAAPAPAPPTQAPVLPAPAPSDAPGLVPADKLLRTDTDPAAARWRIGGPAVQLAAFGSAAAAQTEWSRLCRSHPALFSGRSPEIDQADHEGHTIYRLRTRGFARSAEATSFCEQARAQHVACTLAAF